MPRRSLQFLELSEGLTLVAVVCEDLARLDEVAELLRDVGPTLVVTILLDGPQLARRWTARYASVLADDPGTAVLTLTAHGMVRAQPADRDAAVVGRRPVEGPHPRPARDLAGARRHGGADERGAPPGPGGGSPTAGRRSTTRPAWWSPGCSRWPPRRRRAARAPRTGRVTGAALDAADLTIVTAWADAVAEALEHAPERVDG